MAEEKASEWEGKYKAARAESDSRAAETRELTMVLNALGATHNQQQLSQSQSAAQSQGGSQTPSELGDDSAPPSPSLPRKPSESNLTSFSTSPNQSRRRFSRAHDAITDNQSFIGKSNGSGAAELLGSQLRALNSLGW